MLVLCQLVSRWDVSLKDTFWLKPALSSSEKESLCDIVQQEIRLDGCDCVPIWP